MARDKDMEELGADAFSPSLAPGEVMVMKNHGAIINSRHRFWEAGTITSDPAEIAALIRSGAVVEQG